MRNLDQIIGALPDARREKVAAHGRTLIAEEMALRQLRQARDLTQTSMATLLEIDQAGISKIEKRSDMLISTMRSYVEAMGGHLRLLAEFGEGQIVELKTLGDVARSDTPQVKRVSKKGARRPERMQAD